MQKNMISLWPLRIQGKQVSKPEIKYLRQHWSLKRLGRQLSMRILGAKFKFSVGHGKFNFRPLYAEIASSGWIPIVSFVIEAIIAVDLKKYHASIIVWRNFVYFSTVTRKNGSEKDRSARTCRPTDAFSWVCLISSSSLGRLGLFLLGCWAWYCHKFLQQNDMFLQACHRQVDREIRAICTQACRNVIPVYAYVVRQLSWFKFHRITRGTYNYWKRLILSSSDKASDELHACMQTNTTGLRFSKESLECFA